MLKKTSNSHIHKQTNRYTDWPIYRLTDIQTDRYTDWPIYRLTDIQTDRYTDWPIYRLTDIQTDRYTDRHADIYTDNNTGIYRVFHKNLTQFYTINLKLFAIKWRLLQQNVQQKLLPTNQRKICVSVKLAIQLNWSEFHGLFNLEHSSAAGVSSEIHKHRPPETHPEQLLGDNQPKLINGAISQWSLNDCYWSFVCRVVWLITSTDNCEVGTGPLWNHVVACYRLHFAHCLC